MPEARHIVCPHCVATNRLPLERNALAAKCGACHAPVFSGHPADVDSAALDRHLRGNDIPVLLDVWAPWCGPCRGMAPMYARAAQLLEPDFRLLKLNADTAPDVTSRLGVRGIPALFLFRCGQVVARMEGATDTNTIVAWARRHATEAATVTGR